MSLGRKVRAMVIVAVLGLDCDGDKYDWKRGKSKRRRSGVRTEIGDNFSLFFLA